MDNQYSNKQTTELSQEAFDNIVNELSKLPEIKPDEDKIWVPLDLYLDLVSLEKFMDNAEG